jgi:hypothetical protein
MSELPPDTIHRREINVFIGAFLAEWRHPRSRLPIPLDTADEMMKEFSIALWADPLKTYWSISSLSESLDAVLLEYCELCPLRRYRTIDDE